MPKKDPMPTNTENKLRFEDEPDNLREAETRFETGQSSLNIPNGIPQKFNPSQILSLQRRIGNKAVMRLLKLPHKQNGSAYGPIIQRKPGDQDRIAKFIERNPGYKSILAELSSEADKLDEDAIVKKLLISFFNRGDFTYSGASNVGMGSDGDCHTLTTQFITIAKECFELVMTEGELKGDIFVKGGGKIIDKNGRTGNIDKGAHWKFDNHYWVVWNGKNIDVLFGLYDGLKKASKITVSSEGTFTFEETTYYTRDPFKFGSDQSNNYTSNKEERYVRPHFESKPKEEEKPPLAMEERLEAAKSTLTDTFESFVSSDKLKATVTKVLNNLKERPVNEWWLANSDRFNPSIKAEYLKLFCTGTSMMNFEFSEEKWSGWIK